MAVSKERDTKAPTAMPDKKNIKELDIYDPAEDELCSSISEPLHSEPDWLSSEFGHVIRNVSNTIDFLSTPEGLMRVGAVALSPFVGLHFAKRNKKLLKPLAVTATSTITSTACFPHQAKSAANYTLQKYKAAADNQQRLWAEWQKIKGQGYYDMDEERSCPTEGMEDDESMDKVLSKAKKRQLPVHSHPQGEEITCGEDNTCTPSIDVSTDEEDKLAAEFNARLSYQLELEQLKQKEPEQPAPFDVNDPFNPDNSEYVHMQRELQNKMERDDNPERYIEDDVMPACASDDDICEEFPTMGGDQHDHGQMIPEDLELFPARSRK